MTQEELEQIIPDAAEKGFSGAHRCHLIALIGCHHALAAGAKHTDVEYGRLTWWLCPFNVYTALWCVNFCCRKDNKQPAESQLLSAGRHQRKSIMCNYNRQSKTKPFTYNEFLLKKGRLPQGGILMKQMAECAQGQTQTVLLFTVCQHFQHSEELHLSLDCSLCASERMCVRVCRRFCLLKNKKKNLSWEKEKQKV